MSGTQSEDAPLLTSVPPSPATGEKSNLLSWNTPSDDPQPSCSTDFQPEVTPRWNQGHRWPSELRVDEPPRAVPSQSSMDSGCDCDPEAVAPSMSCDEACDTKATDGGSQPLQITSCDKLANGFTRVTFRIEGYEHDDSEENRDSQNSSEDNGDFKELVKAASRTFPRIPSFSKTGVLSSSSSTASMPMCRICHLPQGEGQDILISPCRCSGTMQFIHEHCLMRWLEICSKRNRRSPTCELCNYQFHRHKKFQLTHWKLPTCSFMDKFLHSLFIICMILMIVCAGITIYCFKQDRFQKKREDTDLTRSEIITLTCGVLFFVAFFVAMYVEVKAKDTLYRLFSRFMRLNQTWHIDEYDKRKDDERCQASV